MFSKAWVLSLLVKAVEVVEEGEQEKEEEGRESEIDKGGTDAAGKRDVSDPSGADNGERGAGKCVQEEEEVLELDEEIENDLCQLWDASVNEVYT